jgi:hypothetical protein
VAAGLNRYAPTRFPASVIATLESIKACTRDRSGIKPHAHTDPDNEKAAIGHIANAIVTAAGI